MKKIILIFLINISTASVFGQVFHENMEIPDSVFSSSNGTGNWAINNRIFTSGIACDSANLVNPGDSIMLTTISFSTLGLDSVFLYFNHISKIEFFDNSTIDVSTDGGITWQQLKDDMGAGWGNNNCYYLGYSTFKSQGSKFGEASYGSWMPGLFTYPEFPMWRREIFDASFLLANKPNVKIRFVLSDGNNTGPGSGIGWFIDDIMVDSTLNSNLYPFANRMTGTIFIDSNFNLFYDIGEQKVILTRVFETGTNFSNYTDANGKFDIITSSTGNVVIKVDSMSHWFPYFSIIPTTNSATFPSIGMEDSLNDFALQPIGNQNDLAVILTPLSNFWSGFKGSYIINFYNYGNTSLTPILKLYNDPLLSFDTASVPPTFIYNDSLVWIGTPTQPLERSWIFVTYNINTAPAGTPISSYITIEPFLNDANIYDNTDSSTTIISNSFGASIDPNEITVNRDTLTTQELPDIEYLDYIVYFQNTGTGPATMVRVENLISNKLDLSTLQLVGFSHPVTMNCNSILNPRLISFNFENINLPDSNSNEPYSHGFIRYRIKPITSLIAGDSIPNSASIFFDFNSPVNTNIAITHIIEPTSTFELPQFLNGIKTVPNPVNDELRIEFYAKKIAGFKIEIFNQMGQKVNSLIQQITDPGVQNVKFNTSEFPNGLYFVRVETDHKIATSRFVKIRNF